MNKLIIIIVAFMACMLPKAAAQYTTLSAVCFCNGKFFDDSFGKMVCKLGNKTFDTITFTYSGGGFNFMETDLEPLWEYENQMLANGQELRDTDCSIVVVLQIHPYGQTWDSRKITIPIPYSQIGPFREMKSAHLQFFITMKDDSYFIYLQSDAGYKYFYTTQQGRKAKRIERKMIALQWRYYNAKNGLLGKMW